MTEDDTDVGWLLADGAGKETRGMVGAEGTEEEGVGTEGPIERQGDDKLRLGVGGGRLFGEAEG